MNIKDERLGEIDNVIQRREFSLTMSAEYTFLLFYATSQNNVSNDQLQ